MRGSHVLRPSVLAYASILTAGLTPGCTQDFDQFHPGASVFTGGVGGASGLTAQSSSSTSHGSTGLSVGSSAAVTSSSTGGSMTSSTGTGTSVAEDCVNGKDDDGDGAVDCADDDCNPGFTCVASAPSGWAGPAAFYEGNPAGTPACPGMHPTATPLGNSGLIDTPALCSACTCSAPSGQCLLQPLSLESDGCAISVGAVTQPPPGACQPIAPLGTTKAMRASPPASTGGACGASTVTVTRPPPAWQIAGLACWGGGFGGGCGANAACAPTAKAPFATSLCVFRSGDVACPAAFPQKHVFVNSVNDTRGCSPCSCGAPTVTCAAVTTVHGGPNCNGASTQVPNDGSCVNVGSSGSSIDVAVTKTGGCVANGGQPTGTLQEGQIKTTVCCAP